MSTPTLALVVPGTRSYTRAQLLNRKQTYSCIRVFSRSGRAREHHTVPPHCLKRNELKAVEHLPERENWESSSREPRNPPEYALNMPPGVSKCFGRTFPGILLGFGYNQARSKTWHAAALKQQSQFFPHRNTCNPASKLVYPCSPASSTGGRR